MRAWSARKLLLISCHSAIARCSPAFPDKVLERGAAVRVAPAEQQTLRALLSEVEECVWGDQGNSDALANATSRRHLERELVEAYLSALCCEGSNLLPPETRLAKRYRRLRQAQEFIAEHANQSVHLDDLCAELNLGRRSVENLFKELLDVQPSVYLRNHGLHLARRRLLQSSPDRQLVKNIARDFGFWHMGRFSHEYKSLFGEAPSETLHSRP